MRVVGVDERTTRWEIELPAYRVYFFDNPHGSRASWTTYTYELTEAHNVHQVIAWADANAHGHLYCVYAVVPQSNDGDVGLLQLTGADPNSPHSPRATPPPDLRADAETRDHPVMQAARDKAREAGR
jgi:hypothetical protein